MEFIYRERHRLYAYELRSAHAVGLRLEASVYARAANGREIMQFQCSGLTFGEGLWHHGRKALHTGFVAAECQRGGAAVADIHITHHLAPDGNSAEVDAGCAEFKPWRKHVQTAAGGLARDGIATLATELDLGHKRETARIVAERHPERHQGSVAGRYGVQRGVEQHYHILAAVHVGRDAVAGGPGAAHRHAPLHRLDSFRQRHAYLGGRHIGGVCPEGYGYRRLLARCPVAACHCHDIGRVDGRQAGPQRQCRKQQPFAQRLHFLITLCVCTAMPSTVSVSI